MSKLEKIMNKNVFKLKKTATVSEAVKKLSRNPETGVIIEENNKPIGIITATDIIKFLSNKKGKLNQKVTTLMSSPVTTIRHSASLEKANKVIDTKQSSNYPIIKGKTIVGVISQADVVRAINDNMSFHRHLQNGVLIVFLVYAITIIIVYGGSAV